ncbi:MAG: hypothetical protein A2583_11730 [Bdellovibrionales bacterium RIFOXYD1_FULL_53_11]|nr:MAG: hypothetical protein A2583_11730 [Bdellovibrionales bacterium RIFOXYD1_FULL_53_11]
MQHAKATVLILCGGRGSRLKHITQEVPKAMVQVDGKPMLAYIMDAFVAQGFGRFVLATGYLSDVIEKFVSVAYPSTKKDTVVELGNAGVDAGMLRRIDHARSVLPPEPDTPVIVAYGDTLVDIDYRDLVAKHAASGAEATIVTGRIRSPFGIVDVGPDARVGSFNEKPVFDYYIGCFVCARLALDKLDAAKIAMHDGTGLVAWFEELSRGGRLAAYRHEGLQITFNTEPELSEAGEALRKFRTLRENT